MKTADLKQALKKYQQFCGNWKTQASFPLKTEKELGQLYYPGILKVLEAIQKNPKKLEKFCQHHETFAIISTRGKEYYPLLTARAAVLSEVTGANIVPLMIRYKKVRELPALLDQFSPSFQAYLATDLLPEELRVLKSKHTKIPTLIEEDMYACSIAAALQNACSFLKRTPKTANIVIEGISKLTQPLIELLLSIGYKNITLVDERGALYKRRPNMNRQKNDLVKLLKSKKNTSSYAEIMESTDIYLSDLEGDIKASKTSQLPSHSVIVSLRSMKIELQRGQTIISTLPGLDNHLTDLHATAGAFSAISQGFEYQDKKLPAIAKALADEVKTPNKKKLIPSLLHKNLSLHIAKRLQKK